MFIYVALYTTYCFKYIYLNILEFLDDFEGWRTWFLIRNPDEDELLIAASEGRLMPSDSEDLAGIPPSGAVAPSKSYEELAAILARATMNIGLEWNPQPCPKNSQLDDWYLGSELDSQPRPAPVPFIPEVHEELTKSWRAQL